MSHQHLVSQPKPARILQCFTASRSLPRIYDEIIDTHVFYFTILNNNPEREREREDGVFESFAGRAFRDRTDFSWEKSITQESPPVSLFSLAVQSLAERGSFSPSCRSRGVGFEIDPPAHFLGLLLGFEGIH